MKRRNNLSIVGYPTLRFNGIFDLWRTIKWILRHRKEATSIMIRHGDRTFNINRWTGFSQLSDWYYNGL